MKYQFVFKHEMSMEKFKPGDDFFMLLMETIAPTLDLTPPFASEFVTSKFDQHQKLNILDHIQRFFAGNDNLQVCEGGIKTTTYRFLQEASGLELVIEKNNGEKIQSIILFTGDIYWHVALGVAERWVETHKKDISKEHKAMYSELYRSRLTNTMIKLVFTA